MRDEELSTLETLTVVKLYIEWLKDPTSDPESAFNLVGSDTVLELIEFAIDREQNGQRL